MTISPPPPPPHQLYPQLASALTTPRSNSSNSSTSDYPYQFKSPLQLQHSTLAMKLNEKPKHMTEDQQVTSELLHSIIMRGSGGSQDEDEDDDDMDDVDHQLVSEQLSRVSGNRDGGSSIIPATQTSSSQQQDNSQVPLNLSKKIVC